MRTTSLTFGRISNYGWCRLAKIVYAPDPALRYIPPPTTIIPFNLSASNYTHPKEEELEPVGYEEDLLVLIFLNPKGPTIFIDI